MRNRRIAGAAFLLALAFSFVGFADAPNATKFTVFFTSATDEPHDAFAETAKGFKVGMKAAEFLDLFGPPDNNEKADGPWAYFSDGLEVTVDKDSQTISQFRFYLTATAKANFKQANLELPFNLNDSFRHIYQNLTSRPLAALYSGTAADRILEVYFSGRTITIHYTNGAPQYLDITVNDVTNKAKK